MILGKIRITVVVLSSLLLFHPAAQSANPERGRMLHENHCTSCHESTIHIRDEPKAKSIADINYQIMRWQNVLSLQWTTEEVEDVLQYLNERFYHYEPQP